MEMIANAPPSVFTGSPLDCLASVAQSPNVRALKRLMGRKGPDLLRHCEEVAFLASRMADHLRVSPAEREAAWLGGLLHDLGKLGCCDEILNAPRALTPEEQGLLRMHPAIGAAVASGIGLPELVVATIRHHHERWDGQGYPDGLGGSAVPFTARIVGVADAYSAMTATRPYRPALCHRAALAVLRAGSGVEWDRSCVEALHDVLG
jgi:putative nucleotidyltransferase with HDIG domain